ncbi:MAG TPA: PilT/PilU family type 4a pilus ATPase [Blastocatellia bacterium]|nr:PilT/PilU family type 4a pilus ATPase [Blastocatellia bacterium]
MPINVTLLSALSGHSRDATSAAFSPDGKLIVSGSADRSVRIWAADSLKSVHTMEHGEWVNAVAFAPSGQFVASAGGDGAVKLWSAETGQPLGGVKVHAQNATALTFSPDGSSIISAGAEGAVRILKLREKKLEASLNAHAGRVWHVALSSIGDRLLSTGQDGVARIWKIGSNDTPLVLEGHQGDVLWGSFSPDDHFIATGGGDGTARLWDSQSGRQLYQFAAHQGGVNSVRFSPDGIHLVTAGSDSTARIWLAESGQQIEELNPAGGPVAVALFSRDGKRMASCGADGRVMIWQVGEKASVAAGPAPELTAGRPDQAARAAAPGSIQPKPAQVSKPTNEERSGSGEPLLHSILSAAIAARASDVHIPSGAPIQIRQHGRLMPFDQGGSFDRNGIEALLLEVLTDEQRRRFLETNDLDFSYEIKKVGRFRANLCRQHRGVDGTFRVIPEAIPSPADLGLPPPVVPMTKHHQGLVLITGPAGQGKSTTIATLVDVINSEKPLHIITVEDPIEFVHPARRSVVNQREVGKHTLSFANALRAALREDPDVIVVGEMRDLETIGLAITAAETGHLVFGSLMTTNASQTVDRILDSFPAGQQAQIRTMLSESLKGIVSQQLVPLADGTGRVLACEILLCNLAVANMIRERKTFQLSSVMQTGRNLGMQRMDDALLELMQAGRINSETAMMYAHDAKAMEARVGPRGSTHATNR